MAWSVAIFAPTAELRAGDSRLVIGLGYTLLFVPSGIGVVSMLNFTSGQPGLRRVWLGMALVFTLVTAISAVTGWHSARRYTCEGQQTTGRAVQAQVENHHRLLFTYRVGATDYQRSVSAPGKAADYFPGAPVAVYSYRSDPAHGFLAEPRWQPGLVLIR